MNDDLKVFPYRQIQFILLVLVLFIIYFFIFMMIFFSSSTLLSKVPFLIITIVIILKAYYYYKNNVFIAIKGNKIIFNPDSFFGQIIIDISNIESIERPSISKTIIYYRDQYNRPKKVKIGRFGLNTINQIEFNDYIEKRRGVKFSLAD